MAQIDSTGTFRGKVVESGFNLTGKSNYPQAVLRLEALEKYISNPADMAHFGLTAPGWVSWVFEGVEPEQIVAFLVLFKSAEVWDDASKLLNYEQLQLALKWDGLEFESLTNKSHEGKIILFRVEENTYEGKTTLQVSWIDDADASPDRSLKTMDATEVKSLTAGKLKMGKASPKPAVATAGKPAAPKPAPAKPGSAGPASSPAPTTPAAKAPVVPSLAPAAKPGGKPASPIAGSATGTPTTPAAAPKSPSKTPPVAKKPVAPVEPEPVVEEETTEEGTGLAAEVDQMVAWETVNQMKGGNTDDAITDAWQAACAEQLNGRPDTENFEPADWAKVRDIVIRDMALV